MATQRMLIDASHSEETRVAIVRGNHLEDFDVEVEARRQLRGNIYLAKVTRVEPSLQAAFVDYGGNRHGFLAFSEIHPDYYQIPVADREKLIAEHDAAASEAAALERTENDAASHDTPSVETVGGDDVEEAEVRRRMALRRKYKIQEVIKRRQILLVQVVKEERGTKGAALTTYLSLAGRYCVLMPNTARGGGISRKISSGNDRKRLKSMLGDLKIPDGMAVIVRTAGQKRSKAEIKRDYEYLIRVWGSVRETTLESMAPCLVHEEGNLIKRSIRDLYNKDIDEVIVDGDDGYRIAKDFMKLMIPSHTRRVKRFKETNKQMLQFYGVEGHLDGMLSPEVQLKSGGYIVINPTEALVAIDVNSGRATRGRNIEETALKTNVEASDEIARQLRLRDLAGLIVIDFIDMEEHRNQVTVERRLKDAMRSDRARIQIGRISPFGLLELSRQRLRPSLIETSSEPCPYCQGTGIRRSTDTTAIHVMRAIEEEGMQKRSRAITVYVPTAIAIYILNHHRSSLADVEAKYGMSVSIEADDSLIAPDFRLDRVKSDGSRDDGEDDEARAEQGGRRRRRRGRRRRPGDADENAPSEAPEATESDPVAEIDGAGSEEAVADADEDSPTGRGRRRRRGRRGGRRRGRKATEQGTAGETDATTDGAATDTAPETPASPPDEAGADAPAASTPATALEGGGNATNDKAPAAKKRPRRRTRKAAAKDSVDKDVATSADKDTAKTKPASKKKPAKRPRRSTKTKDKTKDKDANDTDTGDAKGTAKEGAPPITPDTAVPPLPLAAASTEAPDGTTVINIDGIPSKNDEEAKPSAKKGWWSRGAG